jgi:hypothetical protein
MTSRIESTIGNNSRTLAGLLIAGLLIAVPTFAAELDVPGQYATIQAAVDAAVAGDEVILADGVYAGAGNVEVNLLGKAITLRSANGPESCVIDGEESSIGLVLNSGETRATVIEGLTIRNCYANNSYDVYHGAAIRMTGASATIRDCVFQSNICNIQPSGSFIDGGGGAIGGENSAPLIEQCRFDDNRAFSSGGAARFIENSAPEIVDCTFQYNVSCSGGAIAIEDRSSALITGCDFEGNRGIESYAASGGWFARGWGGAIYLDTREEITIEDSRFEGNLSQAGGAIACILYAPVFIDQCLFARNAAAYWIEYSGISSFGYEKGVGGAIVIVAARPDCQLQLQSCALVDNYASYDGSVIYSSLVRSTSNIEILNSTITDNKSSEAASSAIATKFGGDGVLLTIVDSILWDNGANGTESDQIHNEGTDASTSVSYTCIQGLDTLAGPTNIDQDPLLTRNGYHLLAMSPCRQAGSLGDPNLVDIDGEQLPLAARDIGADQFVDSEPDTLADAWEYKYAQNLSLSPGDDPDADQLTAAEEYEQSRNPIVAPRQLDVSPDGVVPEATDFPTIQAALDAASRYEGDVITLPPGTYSGPGNGNLLPRGKAVELRGLQGSAMTTINAVAGYPVIRVARGETFKVSGIQIRGFSHVRNDPRQIWRNRKGRAIRLDAGTIEMDQCSFNNADRPEHALEAMAGSNLSIQRSRFSQLEFCYHNLGATYANFRQCIFYDLLNEPSTKIIVAYGDTDASFENCSFYMPPNSQIKNRRYFGETGPSLYGCVISHHTDCENCYFEYSMMYDYTRNSNPDQIGPGMIDGSPQFIDPNNGDLRLMAGSLNNCS